MLIVVIDNRTFNICARDNDDQLDEEDVSFQRVRKTASTAQYNTEGTKTTEQEKQQREIKVHNIIKNRVKFLFFFELRSTFVQKDKKKRKKGRGKRGAHSGPVRVRSIGRMFLGVLPGPEKMRSSRC